MWLSLRYIWVLPTRCASTVHKQTRNVCWRPRYLQMAQRLTNPGQYQVHCSLTWWMYFLCGFLCVSVISHYSDVTMTVVASLITSASIVYSAVCSGIDQRKHQSSSSLAFVREFRTGEFPAQKTSNAENVSILWRHHGIALLTTLRHSKNGLPNFRSAFSVNDN